MMRRFLMTGMAAVALGGLFSSCSKEMESIEGSNSVTQDIVANYEAAFITRFGQPDPSQTWGFGPITSGTRSVVSSPSVTEIGYTFNATMTKANYTSWSNTGWNDKFYQVNGSVVPSNIDSDLRQRAYNTILEKIPEGGPGDGKTNLPMAESTGYSIITEGGPVTLTPIYHQSSSGDMISYYYYPKNTTPNVKTLKKYTIGNMADPDACMTNINALNEYTYSLVYEDASGNVSYDFPKDYVINFIVSNTDKLHNGTVTIDDTEPSLTLQGRYALPVDWTIQSGTERDVIDGKVRIKFGNTTLYPSFAKTQEAQQVINDGGEFKYYYSGNGVNGNLGGGTTCYYFKANETGYLDVAVRVNNANNLKVYEVGSDWNSTNYKEVETLRKPENNNTAGMCAFPVESGKVYAVYEENGQLWYYGYNFVNGSREVLEHNAVPNNWPWSPYDSYNTCGTIYNQSDWNYIKINLKLGKAPNPIPNPVYFGKTKAGDGNHPIENYPYLTEGNGNNGGFGADATTYFIRPTEAGVLRVAVKLSADKTMKVIDLGEYGWSNTRGDEIISDYKSATESYYGTYDFNVLANHVYAVYADGSKLGFFGCEFLKVNSSASTKTINNFPEFYGDGNYNTEIHSCGLNIWDVNPDNTPHIAVFNAEYTNEAGKKVKLNLIGFEDWTDLDFNDVIFAVTGTDGGEEVDIPDPEPEPEPLFRIVAEDLTVDERGDFDFNDVVFDVCPDATTGKTTLIIRAVGGELPLYIGLEGDPLDDAHDVHKVCGIGEMSMTNTGWDGPIKYDRKCGEIVLNTLINDRGAARNNIYVRVIKKKETIRLSATPGRVPSMICVGTDYKWCPERKDIDDIYHTSENVKLFSEYVAGRLGDDWYKNVQIDQSGN